MKPRLVSETNRTESFSDGFFAIAITLLILELRLPAFRPGELLSTLRELTPSLAAFLFSFVYIGVIWLNHHHLFTHIRYVDTMVHLINFGILVTTALLAFPTGVLAAAFRDGNEQDQGVAVALYSLTAMLMSAAWIPVFGYLGTHPELLREHSGPRFFRRQRVRPWIGVVAYGAAAVIGNHAPLWGLAVFAAMVLYHACTSEGIADSRAT